MHIISTVIAVPIVHSALHMLFHVIPRNSKGASGLFFPPVLTLWSCCHFDSHIWRSVQQRSQPYLSGGAKGKNLPDFCLFFLIFPLFSQFFLIFSRFLAIFSLSGVACHWVSFCTSGFGVIIQQDLCILSLLYVLLRHNLNACVHVRRATHT